MPRHDARSVRSTTSTTKNSTLDDFEVMNPIGEGAYSSVFKVCRKSDRKIYALKKVKLPNLTDKEKRNALNEVRLLASVKHDNVVGYKESFFDEPSQCLCIVTEYADGLDLFQKILRHQKARQYIRESEIWHCVFGMSQGLRALHDLQILHRDLKSANVFLTCRGDVKLGDFNVSKVAKRGLLHTQTGTPYYASPEVWKDMPYDAKSDVWSLGCVTYEMAALRPPFRAEDMEGLYRKVLRGQYPRIPGCYSSDLSQLITLMLQVNPKQRPTVAQLITSPLLLRHANRPPSPNFSQHGSLLNTIQLPRNGMELYKTNLPRAQYEEIDEEDEVCEGDAAAGSVGSFPNSARGEKPEPPPIVAAKEHMDVRRYDEHRNHAPDDDYRHEREDRHHRGVLPQLPPVHSHADEGRVHEPRGGHVEDERRIRAQQRAQERRDREHRRRARERREYEQRYEHEQNVYGAYAAPPYGRPYHHGAGHGHRAGHARPDPPRRQARPRNHVSNVGVVGSQLYQQPRYAHGQHSQHGGHHGSNQNHGSHLSHGHGNYQPYSQQQPAHGAKYSNVRLPSIGQKERREYSEYRGNKVTQLPPLP